jgi:phage pi2 protein 07
MNSIAGKILTSLKWRFFYGYCRHLESRKKDVSRIQKWENVDPSLPLLATIVYAADVPLLDPCLFSLKRTHKRVPPLVLIGDSDEACVELKKRFGDASFSIVHWESLLAELPALEQTFVRTWMNSGRWGGYSRKFAITMALQRHGNLLISDADVLWFQDFFSNGSTWWKEGRIQIGEDYNRAYDLEVADLLKEPRLRTDMPVNCGFVYYPKNSLDGVLTDEVFQTVMPHAAKATNHLEQTLIGYAFWQTGGRFFKTSDVATTLSDNFSIKRWNDSAVRHYAGAKHLFWRDA